MKSVSFAIIMARPYRAPLERDLARRVVLDRSAFALAVRAPQEAQQLDLFGVRYDLIGARELHASAVQLTEQLFHAHAEYTGELFDRYV